MIPPAAATEDSQNVSSHSENLTNLATFVEAARLVLSGGRFGRQVVG